MEHATGGSPCPETVNVKFLDCVSSSSQIMRLGRSLLGLGNSSTKASSSLYQAAILVTIEHGSTGRMIENQC